MSCTRTHNQYISSSSSTHVRLANNLQCVSKSCPDVSPVLTDTLALSLLQQCLLSARTVFVNVVNSFIFSVIELRINYDLKKKVFIVLYKIDTYDTLKSLSIATHVYSFTKTTTTYSLIYANLLYLLRTVFI